MTKVVSFFGDGWSWEISQALPLLWGQGRADRYPESIKPVRLGGVQRVQGDDSDDGVSGDTGRRQGDRQEAARSAGEGGSLLEHESG